MEMSDDFLISGSENAKFTILLAHGAGAPMDSKSMITTTQALVDIGFRVVRFEFAYMAARRNLSVNRPPPRADTLNPEYIAVIEKLALKGPLIIGGKSMGGRVASMIADDLYTAGKIAGLLCLGYPFHPPSKPEALRTQHLGDLKTPTLICQGTRDEFGTRQEVAGYQLSSAIEILWLEDGDHDLKPRKKISGFSAADHLTTMAEYVRTWADRLPV